MAFVDKFKQFKIRLYVHITMVNATAYSYGSSRLF